ncbi:MAG: hypothetical protein ACRDNF_16750 [Streptosporangiaceae bacterium]
MPDDSQPELADEFLASQEGSLTIAEIAALAAADRDGDDEGPPPDTGTGMPGELQGLSDQELAEVYASAVVEPGADEDGRETELVWPLSYRTDRPPREHFGTAGRDWSGSGLGFGQGEALDTAPPSVLLAGLADEAYQRRRGLADDSVIGVMRAYRRLAAQAQARELAMIAELARRRPQPGTPPGQGGALPGQVSEFLADEVAVALTLTARAAGTHVTLAQELAGRWRTAAALEQGRIDVPKALVVLGGVGPLGVVEAAAVEAAVLPEACGLNSGQLAAWVAQLALLADPAAVRQRREDAQKQAHVACWRDPEGTATLAGRFLPPAEVLAADRRLAAIARAWKKLGAQGGMDLLRAHAYLALLLSQDTADPPPDLLPENQHPATAGRSFGAASPSQARRPGQRNRHDPATGSGAGGCQGPVNPDRPDGRDDPEDREGPGGPWPPDERQEPATSSRPDEQADEQDIPAGSHRPDSAERPPGPADHRTDTTGCRLGSADRATDAATPPPDATGCRTDAADHPPGPADHRTDPTDHRPASAGSVPPFTGTVNLTIPLITLLGLADRPGEAAGFGPLHADTARDIAEGMSAHPGTRWHLIVTDPSGRAMGFGGPARARRAAKTTTHGNTGPPGRAAAPDDSRAHDPARGSPTPAGARATPPAEVPWQSPARENPSRSPVLFGAGGWKITLTTEPVSPYH